MRGSPPPEGIKSGSWESRFSATRSGGRSETRRRDEPNVPGEAWIKSKTACFFYWRKYDKSRETSSAKDPPPADNLHFFDEGRTSLVLRPRQPTYSSQRACGYAQSRSRQP